MEERNERIEGEVSIRSPIVTKLENYWYHYKWHTIVALFLVITVTVASLQMCTRTTYDLHIIYAGNHQIKKSAESGNSTTPFTNTLKSLCRVVPDANGDGEVHVDLLDLFIMTGEEIADFYESSDGTTEINEIQIKENTENLESNYLLFGGYYIFFLSPALFEKYDARYDGALFSPIASYTEGGLPEGAVTENGRGVRLSDLGIYELAGICELPADTVICIRNPSLFSTSSGEENYRYSEEAMRAILSYKIK